MLGRPVRSNLPSRGLWRIVDDRILAVDRTYSGPTTVLVPSEDVLTVAVDLPFATRAQRLSALPFALEDAVAEPLATLHFALGTEVAPRRHIAGVVRHARIQGWIALLTEADLDPAILMPDALTLPMPPQGVWVVRVEGGRCLVRTDTGAGFALPLSALDGAWTAAGRPRLIPLGDALPATFAEAVGSETLHLGTMGEPVVVLPPLDLRQGPYAATRATSASALRTLALVAGVGVVAHIALLGLDTFLLDRMADRKEAEARTVLQAVAPATTPDEDIVAAADRIVPGAGSGVRPFTRLLAQTSGALPGAGAVAFNSATYAPGSLDMGVVVSDAATLDRAVQALTASGLTASGAPSGVDASSATNGLNATLKVTTGAAG
ncbi:General secretion pathway L [Brevundimonas subvibrioides ATCC 15264]|uniref:General secretion pathway L n=1 Tax=Brevundimonas subvibrioides (strain ATCC 15264 / DSM 4735 / LMG 14903 / NBRC 16000 / CB 81) TaxID=633149 RepID=D9QKU2_BRESC|nr:General secretion pathway L [Brevundimonas subvibrioides ATCC 15264]